jgi:hypothetical protein
VRAPKRRVWLSLLALLAAGCGSPTATVRPPATSYTAVPIAPTAWPNGTVGQYGLHVDPTLLGLLPQSVDALPLAENAGSEQGAMDSADIARSFDAYAAASIGVVGDPDWLNLAIGRLKPEAQTADFYDAWQAQYAAGACSQANGVAGSSQQTINDWTVVVSTCNGGPVVYTLKISQDVIVSMYGLGSRDLGRKLLGLLQ